MTPTDIRHLLSRSAFVAHGNHIISRKFSHEILTFVIDKIFDKNANLLIQVEYELKKMLLKKL